MSRVGLVDIPYELPYDYPLEELAKQKQWMKPNTPILDMWFQATEFYWIKCVHSFISLFIHALIHPLNQYLLNTYLYSSNTEVKKEWRDLCHLDF